MDYVKEIERIQREQELAIRAAQEKTERAARAALAQAEASVNPPASPRPPATAGTAVPRKARPGRPAAASQGQAGTRARASAPPAPVAFAARVARAVLLIPLLVALAFIVEGAMNAWDGYHLHPGELGTVIVPLLIGVMVLKLRARLRDPQSWGRELSEPGRKQAAQHAIGRWGAIIVVLLIASAILGDVFPRGLPVGEWLGWPPPRSGA